MGPICWFQLGSSALRSFSFFGALETYLETPMHFLFWTRPVFCLGVLTYYTKRNYIGGAFRYRRLRHSDSEVVRLLLRNLMFHEQCKEARGHHTIGHVESTETNIPAYPPQVMPRRCPHQGIGSLRFKTALS